MWISIHVDSSSGFIKHVIHQVLSWQLDLPKSEVEPPLPEKPGSRAGSQGGLPKGAQPEQNSAVGAGVARNKGSQRLSALRTGLCSPV